MSWQDGTILKQSILIPVSLDGIQQLTPLNQTVPGNHMDQVSRERHRCTSRNTVPSLRDAMRQSIGGPGIMGDQVEEDESGVGGLIPYELLPDDKQTGNHGVIVIDGRELTAHQTSRLASQCGSVRMCNKETRSDMNPESLHLSVVDSSHLIATSIGFNVMT